MALFFATRTRAPEMMDDFSIQDARLTVALENLRGVNRLLGGYRTTLAGLAPYLRARRGERVHLLDLGTGVADLPEYLVRWGARHGAHVEVTAVDANEATVAYAAARVRARLPEALAARVHLQVGDALALPAAKGAYDVAIAATFMHHLTMEEAAALLREMNRVARDGLLVNDLQRHAAAYAAIWALSRLLPVSPMFRHDAPLSVQKGFRRAELERLARQAGLEGARISWHWAFRWLLTTLPEA